MFETQKIWFVSAKRAAISRKHHHFLITSIMAADLAPSTRITLLGITRLSLAIIIFITVGPTSGKLANRDNATVAYVPLQSLPEPFDISKLPNRNRSTSGCLQFLDCIERVPQFKKPEDPLKLSTEFKIYGGGKEQLVPYRPTINCLEGAHNECEFYPFNLAQLQEATFNPTLPIKVVIAGYRSKKNETWQTQVKDLWNQLSDTNVIIVTWSGGSQGMYDTAVANTKVVARQVVVMLYYLAGLYDFQLTDEGFTENIHLIGHSLGAHISGYIGQDFDGKIGRITGLDPAGPLFVDLDHQYALDKTDALFVDVLHTNGGNVNNVINLAHTPHFGMERPIGHIDYYANDGKHQPSCLSIMDRAGCSHNLAQMYYTAFLSYEAYIRDSMKGQVEKEYHGRHRLFAYKSNDYDGFRNGLSLSEFCPIATLNERDLYSKDLDRCSIPIDFVTQFGKLRQDLETVYGLDLDSSSGAPNKYYFYTKDQEPFLNNHILVRVRVSKNITKSESAPKVCDVSVTINMAGGAETKSKLPGYRLLDEQDHYEVVLPLLTPYVRSKYDLARLDADDYYVKETSKLLKLVPSIFPKSIDVHGLIVGTPEQNKGFIGKLKDFLGIDDKSAVSSERHECSLNIESVTVQPIKRLHRHFMATYTVEAMDKDNPDLWFLYDENSSLPISSVTHYNKAAEMDGRYDAAKVNSRISIDTVIVGPHDNSLDPAPVDYDEGIKGDDLEDGYVLPTSSTINGSTWLSLTVVTILLIVIFMTTMMYKFLSSARRASADDKMKLIDQEKL